MSTSLTDIERGVMRKAGCHLYDIRRMSLSPFEVYRLQEAVDDMESMITEDVAEPITTILTMRVGDPVFRQIKVLLQDTITGQIRRPL